MDNGVLFFLFGRRKANGESPPGLIAFLLSSHTSIFSSQIRDVGQLLASAKQTHLWRIAAIGLVL